jgi:hypothetical protein
LKQFVLLTIVFFTSWAGAHEGHHHGSHTSIDKSENSPPGAKALYDEVNREYSASVKPIFEMKCADCHSYAVNSPWYSAIPLLHRVIENDRGEAKEHLEISKGFPFAGHGTPEEDLQAIEEVTRNGTMPTRFYRLMHPSAKLTEDEKSKIQSWVESSQKKLSTLKSPDQK